MQVTDEMVEVFAARFLQANANIRNALEAVLADIPEPVPAADTKPTAWEFCSMRRDASGAVSLRVGDTEYTTTPFVLSDEEQETLRKCPEYIEAYRVLAGAVRRAQRTLAQPDCCRELYEAKQRIAELEAQLAAQTGEPLSHWQRGRVENARSFCGGNSLGEDALRDLVKIFDVRFPKPTPEKTLGRVVYESMRERDRAGWVSWYGVEDKQSWEDAAAAVIAAHEAGK